LTILKASGFKGDLITPEHPAYESSIERWSLNSQKKAQLVAYVKDEQDVALIIHYARENSLDLAIKSGGHSTAGTSSSEGVVIDLSRYLNTVEVDADKKVAYVGGGAIWETVDKATCAKGLATVAGTVNHTGVGGLTLGGGFGYLSGQHGLVIDNLIQVTVVTANGSILNVSDSENPDLFFGIRGGGCNFGVVTKFVLRLHPQKEKVFFGLLAFPSDKLGELITQATIWMETAGENESLMLGFAKAPPGPIVQVGMFYNGSEKEGKDRFKPFFDLNPIMNQSGEIPYVELNGQLNSLAGFGKGRLLKGSYFAKHNLEVTKETFDRLVELTTEEHQPMVMLEHISLKKILSVPNGTSAFCRKVAYNMLIFVTWNNNTPENLETARRITKELNEIFVAGQVEELGHTNLGYANFAMDDSGSDRSISPFKNNSEVLFGDNYPRLQELKKRYDPDNVFSKWFSIAPAL